MLKRVLIVVFVLALIGGIATVFVHDMRDLPKEQAVAKIVSVRPAKPENIPKPRREKGQKEPSFEVRSAEGWNELELAIDGHTILATVAIHGYSKKPARGDELNVTITRSRVFQKITLKSIDPTDKEQRDLRGLLQLDFP